MRKTIEPIDLLACAYLAGQKKNQLQIGRELGLSQATVSRLLKQAKEGGHLRIETFFLENSVEAEVLARVKQRVYKREIENELHEIAQNYSGKLGPELRVFSSQSKDQSREENTSRLQEFSHQAAPFLRELLLKTSICGVSWGQTLNSIVMALEKTMVDPPRSMSKCNVIPLGGEPLGNVPNSSSSSYLAADLGKILNGDTTQTLSLGMVPAFIPSDFKQENELAVIWKLIGLVDGYNQIFGNRHQARKNDQIPLVEKVEMILTSVGPAGAPFGYIGSGLFRAGFRVEELHKLTFGDICGVCIPLHKHSADEKLKLISERWTGIRLEHLAACANRAASKSLRTAAGVENQIPGVVVIAIGKNKASTVLEVVRRGLVNTLIIDNDLEEELKTLINREKVKTRSTRFHD